MVDRTTRDLGEYLYKNETPLLKSISLKNDALCDYFYFSRSGLINDPLGTRHIIPIDHMRNMRSNHDKIYTFSLIDTQMINAPAEALASYTLYIRFPELNPTTRYHFVINTGFNNFNQNNVINYVCKDLPFNQLVMEIGYAEFDNQVTGQKEQTTFLEVNPLYGITYLNLRWKVQTTTLPT